MRFTVKQRNPDWVKELQKAAIDGAIVQWRSTATNKWSDIGEGRDVKFNLPQSEYRIKPAPVVPIESWIVKCGSNFYCHTASKKEAEDMAQRLNTAYASSSGFSVIRLVEETVDED